MPLGRFGRAATWLGSKGMRTSEAIVRRGSTFGFNHPKLWIGSAMAAGAGASLLGDAASPQMQEAVTGDPDAIGNLVRGSFQAYVGEGYNPRDIYEPQRAMLDGGTVFQTPSYLYGRSIQGARLGDIAGSRVMGGWNMGTGMQNRVRGQGDAPIADGSMVFGMWNRRR